MIARVVSTIISNVVVQYGDNKTLTPLMTLDYESTNDGVATSNRATITNGFDMAWTECEVRFVMKAGTCSVTGRKSLGRGSTDNEFGVTFVGVGMLQDNDDVEC